MPEVTFAMDTKMPRLSVSAGNGPEHGQSLDNILGFKITGGYEFQMPITIFHVSIFTFLTNFSFDHRHRFVSI